MPVTAMVVPTGKPICTPGTSSAALDALAASLRQLRAVSPGPFTDLPREGCIARRTEWITRSWPAALNWSKRSNEDAAEVLDLLKAWKKSTDIDELTRETPAVVSPGNSDLNNWLWDSETGSPCLLEWASTGLSDVAYDAADLIEHPSARQFSDDDWISLLPALGVDEAATCRRFLATQRLLALYWLRKLWPERKHGSGVFVS